MADIPVGEWVPHTVVIGELTGVLLLPPGLPDLRGIDLEFGVETEDELRTVVAAAGGIGVFSNVRRTDRLLSAHRYASDGRGPAVDLHVWLGEELASKPEPQMPAAVLRLLDEQAETVIGFPGERARAEQAGLPVAESTDD